MQKGFQEQNEMTADERLDRLEKMIRVLLYIAKENGDFWPCATKEEQQLDNFQFKEDKNERA